VLLASITHSITSFVGNHGIYAVFVLMAVDAVFPAASELVMIYGGALAAGALSGGHVVLFGHRIHTPAWGFVAVALAGTIGYLIGSLVGWGIGAYGGRPLLERRGRWLHLSPARLDAADRWFDRYGNRAVLLGRVTPVVRSFVSIPAGFGELRLGIYTVLTLVGSAVWCFALAGVGWAVGQSYRHFHHTFELISIAVVALLAAAAAAWLWRRRARRSTR
jgi:membrane protein DedA with SNARE-associated domain